MRIAALSPLLALTMAACQSIVGAEDKRLTAATPAPAAGRPTGDRVAGGGQTVAFGVRRFYLGTVDPTSGGDGVPADGYWRKLGFDLDGLSTTSKEITSGDTAQLPPDADAAQWRRKGARDPAEHGRAGARLGSEDRDRSAAAVSLFVGARPPLTATLTRIVPHVVVEVVSSLPRDARRDRVEKIHDYAAAGARIRAAAAHPDAFVKLDVPDDALTSWKTWARGTPELAMRDRICTH